MFDLSEVFNSTTNTLQEYPNDTGNNLSTHINNTASNGHVYRNTIIPDSLKRDAEFFISVLFMPVVCICGLVGNSLALYVFMYMAKVKKHSIYIYMFALVTVDSLTMVSFVLLSVPCIIGIFDLNYRLQYEVHLFVPVTYMDLILRAMNAATLILMSLERLLAMRSPFLVKETVLAKYPMQILAVVFVVIAIGLLPLLMCVEVVPTVGPDGSTINQVMSRENMDELLFVFLILETFTCQFIPYITLVCLNLGIVFQHKRIIRKRKRIVSRGSRNAASVSSMELRVMSVVIVIISMYTVLKLPQISIQLICLANDTYFIGGAESNVFWFFTDISNVFNVVNCSINFIIYILMSDSYRHLFKERFCHCCHSPAAATVTATEMVNIV